MAKMYQRPDGSYVVRHSHGIFMLVDLVAGRNDGWLAGNAKGWKLIGEVPDGIAGGAKSTIAPDRLMLLQYAAKSKR